MKVCLEVNQDSDCKEVPDNTIREMDGDQAGVRQLNSDYLSPVAIMDRFIGQPKVAATCCQDMHEIGAPEIKAENQAGIKASCFGKSSS